VVDQQERITRFRERLRAEPESGVFVPLADLMAAAGDGEGALAVLHEGLARNPRSIPGRVVLGRTLLGLGRQDEAREVLMEVLVADPENLVARHLLADDCRKRGDWDGAVVHLEQLTQINPGEVRWLRELAEARARRADAAGESPAEAGPLQEDKDDDAGFATMTMVEIYLAQGYRQQAIEALRRILDSEPDRVDARQKLELLLLEQTQEPPAEPAEPAVPPPAPRAARAGESREERALRRAEDKARFAAWVEKIRKQGEPGP
jgi:tetratricopeptide (TPR) repeat protein